MALSSIWFEIIILKSIKYYFQEKKIEFLLWDVKDTLHASEYHESIFT